MWHGICLNLWSVVLHRFFSFFPSPFRPKPDYDSWGEESDDEDDGDDDGKRGLYKPKPYPQPSPMMMGAPFAMYYPPPPKGRQWYPPPLHDDGSSQLLIVTDRGVVILDFNPFTAPAGKISGLERYRDVPANSLFSVLITSTVSAVHCDESPFNGQCRKGDKKA